MALDKGQRERLRALCGDLQDDDGVDPRKFFQPTRKRDKARRKSKQLCRQVHKTLDLVFSGETRDELLGDLRIVSVTSNRREACASSNNCRHDQTANAAAGTRKKRKRPSDNRVR